MWFTSMFHAQPLSQESNRANKGQRDARLLRWSLAESANFLAPSIACRSTTRLVRCSIFMKRTVVVGLNLAWVAAGVMIFILVLPFAERSMGLREALGQAVTAAAVLMLFLSPSWLYPKLKS